MAFLPLANPAAAVLHHRPYPSAATARRHLPKHATATPFHCRLGLRLQAAAPLTARAGRKSPGGAGDGDGEKSALMSATHLVTQEKLMQRAGAALDTGVLNRNEHPIVIFVLPMKTFLEESEQAESAEIILKSSAADLRRLLDEATLQTFLFATPAEEFILVYQKAEILVEPVTHLMAHLIQIASAEDEVKGYDKIDAKINAQKYVKKTHLIEIASSDDERKTDAKITAQEYAGKLSVTLENHVLYNMEMTRFLLPVQLTREIPKLIPRHVGGLLQFTVIALDVISLLGNSKPHPKWATLKDWLEQLVDMTDFEDMGMLEQVDVKMVVDLINEADHIVKTHWGL